MKDTIIKGAGNSRTLKTVPNALTLYPDFPSMMQALISGTFPIDFGPINPAGVDVQGTMLNKANLLKDATAALYGKGADAVPDDIFAAIRALITTTQNSTLKITTGSYTGIGSTQTLSFSFAPKLFLCRSVGTISKNNSAAIAVGIGGGITLHEYYHTSSSSYLFEAKDSSGTMTGTTVTITHVDLFASGIYYYVAIG